MKQIRDEFEKGTIDFYSAGTGEKIEAALTKVEEGKLDANYGLVPGNTYQRDALYV